MIEMLVSAASIMVREEQSPWEDPNDIEKHHRDNGILTQAIFTRVRRRLNEPTNA